MTIENNRGEIYTAGSAKLTCTCGAARRNVRRKYFMRMRREQPVGIGRYNCTSVCVYLVRYLQSTALLCIASTFRLLYMYSRRS